MVEKCDVPVRHDCRLYFAMILFSPPFSKHVSAMYAMDLPPCLQSFRYSIHNFRNQISSLDPFFKFVCIRYYATVLLLREAGDKAFVLSLCNQFPTYLVEHFSLHLDIL